MEKLDLEMDTNGNQNALQQAAGAKRRQQRFLIRNIVLAVAVAALLATLCVYELDALQDHPTTQQAATTPYQDTTNWSSGTTEGAEKSDYYHGVDISHYQTDFESEITPEDGLTFAICKATQGTNIEDSEFKNNWAMANNKGLIKGAYHFYEYGPDPVAQANFYIATVGTWGAKDIAPIIDLEQAGIPSGTSPSPEDYQAGVKQFLATVETSCNCTPMIYSGKYFVNQYLNDPTFAKYPLWFAEYTTAEQPDLPTIWESAGYKIWQKSDTQDINSTTVDYDIYYGPKSGLWEK